MLDWLTGSNAPQFWKTYVSKFEAENLHGEKRFVVLDLTATGTDPESAKIVSLTAIGVKGNAVLVDDYLEIHTEEDTSVNENTEGVEKIVEAEALICILNFIGNASLISNNINFDSDTIEGSLKRMNLGKLKNELMDLNVLYHKWRGNFETPQTSLNEMCETLKICKSDRHTAVGDAYTMAMIFLKLRKKLGI